MADINASNKKPASRKPAFVLSSLSNERYKSWIQQVEGDKYSFRCTLCNKNLTCGSSHVERHAKFHETNSNETSENKEPKVPYKQKFVQTWLEDVNFKPWLSEVANDAYLWKCSFCQKTFTCALKNIQRHATSESHLKNCQGRTANLKDMQQLQNVELDACDNVELSFVDRKRTAEIRYAALIAVNLTSQSVGQKFLNFFQSLDPNARAIASMKVSRNKCRYILTNVLCPVETERLTKILQNTKFSIFIDETFDITNRKWMTFLVRFVDSETCECVTQLLKLICIDAKDCSADKLFQAFRNEMWKLQIPFGNIVALSCDNASVMTGRISSFKTRLEKQCPQVLTMPCPCHSSALAANAACKVIPNECEEFIRKIASFLNSSDKRTAIFKEFQECFQESNRRILRLCETRWLSRNLSIERILENWDTLELFLRKLTVSEPSKCADHLLALMQKKEIKAYLFFLHYVLNEFDYFNTLFQASETRIHCLQVASFEFLTGVLKHFLKPDLLKNMHAIRQIDFSLRDNQLSLHQVDLGPDCNSLLQNLQNNGQSNVVENVKQICLQFYVKVAAEIRKRLPFDDLFLSKLNILNSRTSVLSNDKLERLETFKNVEFMSKKIGGFDIDNLRKEWCLLPSKISQENKLELSNCNFDDMWKCILLEKDSNGVTKFVELAKLVNAVRCMPNSNADAERVFSMLSDIVTKKRNKLHSSTINAICVVRSALKARKETPSTMVVDHRHLSLMTGKNLYKYENSKKSELQVFGSDNYDPYDFIFEDE